MGVLDGVFAQHARCPGFKLQNCINAGMVAHIFNPKTHEMEEGESEVNPLLHNKFETSLAQKQSPV